MDFKPLITLLAIVNPLACVPFFIHYTQGFSRAQRQHTVLISSFSAFAVIAAKRGKTAADYPSKGIYYLGGLTEGAETIAIFAAMCLFPLAFPALAYIFATACAATTLMRWHQGWTAFR
jgi:small neutral amino acid transporter SnatA (MarC family)